jgi:iron complex outermembrane receptor protein
MLSRTLFWFALAMLSLAGPLPARANPPAEGYQDFSELDLESLLDQTIVTASRHAQKRSDAPVSATVITAEEIAASGAHSIPELLRRVPGLDVIRLAGSSYSVSARGLNSAAANNLLVLLDGRSVYVDVYGVTVWDHLPVGLDDIASIEVIRGPGSALHGASALAGVINIITRDAGERPGVQARTTVSDQGESYGSLRHSGARGATAWTVSSTWTRAPGWRDRPRENHHARLHGRLTRDLGADRSLSLGGGATNGATMLAPFDGRMIVDGQTHHLRAEAEVGDLTLRWYWNDWDLELDPIDFSLGGPDPAISSSLQDVELRGAHDLGARNFLLWGASYRHLRVAYSLQDVGAEQDIYAGFALQEWRPRRDLMTSVGLRYEHHPITGDQLAPQAGLVYQPADDHALRLSYRQAYRNPSYLETYWRTDLEQIPGFPQTIRGNRSLAAEGIRSLEVGWQGVIGQKVLLDLAVFHNQLDDLVGLRVQGFYPSPPAPQPDLPRKYRFANTSSWRATGGELSWQVEPTAWLHCTGFYAYNWVADRPTDAHVTRAPRHLAHLGLRARLAATHHLRLDARWRGETIWRRSAAGGPFADPRQPGRVLVDAAWEAVSAAGDRRLTLAVENLLDHHHRDHPLGVLQERRLRASVAVGF